MDLDRFNAQLKTLWTPAIAVLASDEAENICWESNSLTVGELLRPFGVLRRMNGGLGVPVRTPAEQPIRLHNWMLRLFDIDDMVQPPTEAATQHLEEVLKRAAAGCPEMPLPELSQTADAAAVDAGSPWYPVYCQEFFRMLNFGAHETMDRPVACVLALPSTFQGENPSSAFAELFDAKAPPLLKQAVRDSQVTMHYLFIHDAQEAPAEDRQRAAQALQSLASTSGSAGHVITVNSPGHPRADPALWADCLQQRWRVKDRPASTAGFAKGVSQSDAASIAAFVEELAVRKVAPHIESRIRQLDQTVVAARKGFRNQLKSLLFRKSGSNPVAEASGQSSPTRHGHIEGGPHSPTSGTPHHYSSSSVEAQMRQLSDLALMVGDCDTALSTLRLLASDYKSDKAYLHFAGVQETMAAATVLCDGSSADVVANFKEAFYRYDQVAQQHGQSRAAWYATRSAVLLAGYLSAAGRYSDASWIVMKAHFQDDDLRAALLIEQAAQLLRRTDPPRLRKFAFHMVLAGLRFSKGGARDMATRAYLQAVQVYRGRRWEIVEEHVREALGKGAREGGDAVAAVEHFAATLLCPQIPPGLQSLHLSQFADALQAATKQLGYAPVVDLPLPMINTRKVGVSSAGQAGYVNVAAREAPREVWNTLENALGPGTDSSVNWKDSNSRMNSRMSLGSAASEAQLCCCVGEDVGVDVELTNPLGIELAITHLRLSCTFDPAAAAPAMGGTPAAAPRGTPSVSPANSPSPGSAGLGGLHLPFQVREEKITLYPGERAVVHLRVRPLRTGSLHVDGVQWQLNGVATGQKAFVIPRRWVTDKASNAALLANIGEEEVGGVDVKVLPPMPRLDLAMEDLSSTLMVGQVAKCTLRLKNAGAMTLHALRAAIDVENVLLQFKASQTVPRRQGVAVTAASSSIRLGVNEELTVDVYIRPTRPGPFTFNLGWYYEPLVKLDALPYRTLRATFSVSVLPALEITGWAGQLPGSDGQRLMVLKGLNLQGVETFKLREVEVLGGDWEARLAGQEKLPQARSVVSLEHVVGPESAVVLHMVLNPAASPPECRPKPVAEVYLIDGECRPARQAIPRASSRNGNSNTAATERPLYALLRWEASGMAQGTVEGFNVVRIGRAKEGGGMGVAARLLGPQSVVYDFSTGPAASVDFALEVSHQLPCALELEWRGVAPPGEEPVRPQRFTWSGLAAGTLQAVTPGTTMRLPLRISVRSAGWVAIEGVWLAWRCREDPALSGSLTVPTSHVLVHENEQPQQNSAKSFEL